MDPAQSPCLTPHHAARRMARMAGRFLLHSEVRHKAWMLVAMLVVWMVALNALNVGNSYVARYFMSAVESKDGAGFARYAWMYLAVFLCSAFAGVWFRYCEERLGLLWREWLTRRVSHVYIELGLFRRDSGHGISNPDQRITEDVRQLTTTTLSFVLMVVNGTLTVLSFSGVLWTIHPKLFVIAVLYAVSGSFLTIRLGKPLLALNYQRADREADFRAALIHLREQGLPVGDHGAAAQAESGLRGKIDALCANLLRIIRVNRNLGYFTNSYNYLIQLIPLVIVAPMFIEGDIEFGVIGQAALAFATLLGAFSLVVTQFQSLSSYAAVVLRLCEFAELAESAVEATAPSHRE